MDEDILIELYGGPLCGRRIFVSPGRFDCGLKLEIPYNDGKDTAIYKRYRDDQQRPVYSPEDGIPMAMFLRSRTEEKA